MNTYSEALEEQAALLRTASVAWAHKPLGEADLGIQRALRYGETFWLGGDATHLVHTAAGALPAETFLSATLVPSRQGFLLSSAVHALVVDDQLGPLGLRGFLWDSATILQGDDPSQVQGVGITVMPLLGAGEHAKQLFVDTQYPWVFGASVADTVARNTRFYTSSHTKHRDTDGGEFVLRLFGSLCLFLQQHVVVAAPERADRAARRRLEHAGWLADPVVRVIQLRRRESRADHAGDSVARDWTCQWLVRGHWRQQFYPSLHLNQPIWIAPYVKGPSNRPLKAPRATVFAVVQ